MHLVNISLSNVEGGVAAIATAGTSFQEITAAVTNMREQIEDISAITEQISAATEEVAASITQIDSAAAHNAEEVAQTKDAITQQVSTLQEISAITADLSNRAVELRNEVNRFKMKQRGHERKLHLQTCPFVVRTVLRLCRISEFDNS